MEINNFGKTLTDYTIPSSQRVDGTKLGQQDFLKVMVEQMRNQNPLDPQDNGQFFTQMVQFQSLDAMTAMSAAITKLVEIAGLANGSALVGRQVSALVDAGKDPLTGFPLGQQLVTGVVDRVSFEQGSPVVHVDNRWIPANQVTEVS
jgi:flagellar basal-body rod modification protein FlgD